MTKKPRALARRGELLWKPSKDGATIEAQPRSEVEGASANGLERGLG